MSLRAGWALSGLDFPQLWLRYLATGGLLRPEELYAGLRNTTVLKGVDHDILAQALNEHLADLGLTGFPVAYADELGAEGSGRPP